MGTCRSTAPNYREIDDTEAEVTVRQAGAGISDGFCPGTGAVFYAVLEKQRNLWQYENGAYQGDSDVGKLMHDFRCTDAADMNFVLLADRTRYLKENPKGVSEMCKVIEEMRKEEREEGMKEGIKKGMKESMVAVTLRMLEAGKYALEKIATISGLSFDEVKEIQKDKSA